MTDQDEAAQVRQIWAALGLPGVIDVHTHFMPKSVMDKVWHYFDSAGPLLGRQWPITYRAAESRRVQLLRQFGVRGFTALVYPHKPQMAAWLNQWAAQFARSTPDCLATATFYPEPEAGRLCRGCHPRRGPSLQSTCPSRPLRTQRPSAQPCLGCHRGRPGPGGDSLRLRAGPGRTHRA